MRIWKKIKSQIMRMPQTARKISQRHKYLRSLRVPFVDDRHVVTHDMENMLKALALFSSQDMGYTPDFISHCIKPLIHDIKKQGIRVVTNGGGINPEGCINTIIKRHVI
uniref:Acyclic terpene utilisation N-terminal domain-containing protein n=2 Tax=Amphimedon queenslandica TaxID=400682 RepID=A0A1X7UM60_AMPQE